MSLDLAASLRVVLASSPPTRRSIVVLQYSHSAMSAYDDPATEQAFYIWSEPYEGTVTTEDGVRTVLPVNFECKLAGTEANLDQVYEIRQDLTNDTDDVFREQLDLIPLDTEERVRCVLREYLSDDLTDVVAGPADLQVESVSFQVGAATLQAVSPRYNSTRTGELYTSREIPMLRGFL